jgi:hypothetical protein
MDLLLFGELRPKILLQELEQAQLMWSSAVEQNAEMLSQVQQLITSVNGEKIDLKWDWHRIHSSFGILLINKTFSALRPTTRKRAASWTHFEPFKLSTTVSTTKRQMRYTHNADLTRR